MSDSLTLVAYDEGSRIDIVSENTQIVNITEDSGLATIVVESKQGDSLVASTPNTVVELVAGDLYFANIAADLVTGAVKTNDFTVIENGQTSFYISSTARRILHVMVNQIDYADDCEITPLGSGNVKYTVPLDGYEFEVGDRVVIFWTI